MAPSFCPFHLTLQLPTPAPSPPQGSCLLQALPGFHIFYPTQDALLLPLIFSQFLFYPLWRDFPKMKGPRLCFCDIVVGYLNCCPGRMVPLTSDGRLTEREVVP